MMLSTRTLALGAAGVVAIVAGTIGYAHAHPTVPDNPPAVYGLDPAAAPEDPSIAAVSAQGRHVSVRFVDAPVDRVLEWLGKQDANFVVASSSVPTDLKITLSVKDQPLDSVEHAIAAAMGGSWAKRDGILVFNKRSVFDAPFALAGDGDGLYGAKELKALPEGAHLWTSPDGKALELKLKGLKDMPDRAKLWEGPDGKALELKIEGLKDAFGPEFQKKMQDQFGPAFQKKMEGLQFNLKGLRDQFGPEFQKKLQDELGPEFQKKLRDGGPSVEIFAAHSQNLTALLSSLSDAQKSTMQRKGYLTPKDLTEHQRQMLGDMKGKFEVKVQSDKGSMTIKSE